MRSGGRSANIWKSQETLTKTHEETVDKDALLRQLRANIVLKTMRKAHNKNENGVDRERENVNTQTEKDKAIARLPYSELSIFKIRKVEDIAKDAKANFNISKKRGKKKKESKNLGKPLPIFKELIHDIKKEHFVERRQNKNKNRRNTLYTLATDFTDFSPSMDLDTIEELPIEGLPKETVKLSKEEIDKIPNETENINSNSIKLRPLSANNAIANLENRVLINSRRPFSASAATFEKPSPIDTTTTTNYTTFTRNNTKVSFYDNIDRNNKDDKYHDEFELLNETDLVQMINKIVVVENPDLPRNLSPVSRRVSSFMSASAIENDEKIKEALRRKDLREK